MYLIAAYILITPVIAAFFAYIIIRLQKKPCMQADKRALLFHSINRKKENGLSHIHPDLFKSFLDSLQSAGMTPVTMRDTVLRPENKKALALIFDDGFEDFYHNAFPLLVQANMTATIFPVVKSITEPYSWDLYSNRPSLTKEQLREIADAGFEIGSHTLTHPDLTRLSDKELHRELIESKQILESYLDKPVTSLSFPFGSWNKRVWACAQQCGYTAAAAYRSVNNTPAGVIGALGVYSFDSLQNILEKAGCRKAAMGTVISSAIMPHFAKGSAMTRFRKEYSLISK